MAYYCDTQKQSSGEFTKFIGKQLCRSPFLNKVAGGRPIKKETSTQCLQEHFRKTTLSFFHLFWELFTRIPEVIRTFQERFIFQIIVLFFLFMSGFYTMEPRQVDDPSNRTKQRLYWQSIHVNIYNITKTRNFLSSF